MIVGIISDTHGSYEHTSKAIELLSDADLIIHLGDVLYTYSGEPTDLVNLLSRQDNIQYVKGNCDSFDDENSLGVVFHDELIVNLDEYTLYATHGHLNSSLATKLRAKEVDADIVATGHTHKKHLLVEDDIIFINPGSVSLPRDDSRSIAKYVDGTIQLIDIDTGYIKDIEDLKKDATKE